MSATRPEGKLVVVVSSAELVGEAVAASLEPVAEVRWFPAGRGGTAGLLDSLSPDGIVIDDSAEPSTATAFARRRGAPLVHILLGERRLRLLRNGRWNEQKRSDLSPDAIRNLLVSGIFGRERVR